MKTLTHIEVIKLEKEWGVFITYKSFIKEYTFQTGPNYKTKKEALKRANDWFENKDFFEDNRIFHYKVDHIDS